MSDSPTSMTSTEPAPLMAETLGEYVIVTDSLKRDLSFLRAYRLWCERSRKVLISILQAAATSIPIAVLTAWAILHFGPGAAL